MYLNRNTLGLSLAWASGRVEEYSRPKPPMPPTQFLDYSQWTKEADIYAERLLSQPLGEIKEEIEILLSAFPEGIKTVKRLAQGIRGYSIHDVEIAERLMHETIYDLRADYGIEDTKALEKIQQELADWLHERRMEQHPGQAYCLIPGH
jgi:hypothetical protein